MSESRPAAESPSFETGQYLYCAVSADDDATFAAAGIEGAPVSLLTADGIGIVHHPVDSVYDSDDLAEVRQWLLSHQQVVDEAGQTFGTPLPFRFDTILTGNSETIREWVRDHRASIEEALAGLDGRWEYRVSVAWDRSALRAALLAADPELHAQAEAVDDAESGTAYLREQQLEQAMRERMAERRDRLAAELQELLAPHAVEVEQASSDSVLGEDDRAAAVQLSVLATTASEEPIGDRLATIEQRGHCEVRYTGPWPPYTFAPAIDTEPEP